MRVGPSGRHARRRDPDCRVSVGRTAVQRGGGAACRAASRRAVCAEASNPRRQNRGVMSVRWSHSPTPRPADRPETPCPPHRLPPSWCGRAGSQGTAKGPVFRAIDRWGAVADRALTPQSINLIVKRRCAMAGLDPRDYSVHRLRAGYLTEAARRGCAAGGDAAVAAPSGAAGGERLQRGRPGEGQGGALRNIGWLSAYNGKSVEIQNGCGSPL